MDIFLNWLWRGLVVAGAASALVWALGPLSPRTRYRVWWAALVLTLCLPLLPAFNDVWLPEVSTPALVGHLTPLVSLPDSASRVNSTLALLWLVWVMAVGGRILAGAVMTRAVKRRATPVSAELERRLVRWRGLSARGRRAPLVISDDVRLAAVLGVGSPVIAISPAIVDALSRDDLDRVLVHEWAHVQRRDDLANALQLAIRSVIGWHPGAWWIGRQLDLERELACDEQAIAITGGVKPYASCLATLATLVARGTTLPVPAALRSSNIHRRVSRVLALPRAGIGRWSRGAATVSTAALCLLATSIASVELVDVYAAEVVAAIQGRSFALPSLRVPETAAAVSSASESSPRAKATVRGAATPHQTPAAAGKAATTVENEPPPESTAAALPSASTEPAVVTPTVLASTALPHGPLSSSQAVPEPPAGVRPWTAAADAGIAVGAGSQKAAVATAGFFSRFGKSVARSF